MRRQWPERKTYMQKALLIAEKPSLRRAIEEVYRKHESEIPYKIDFKEQSGHLLTLKMPSELDDSLKNWSWDHLPFNPEDYGGFKYKVISEKKTGHFKTPGERYNEIKGALKNGGYDFVINAGDPDQEGELLIQLVLKALKNTLPVKRYWSNDLTEPKILEALKNLRDDDNDPMFKNLLSAAYARQRSDYRVGMNLSEAGSLKMGTRVALGRVKTPIMAIVCRRENEIKNFRPTTVYGVVSEYSEGFTGQYFNPSEKNDGDISEKDKDQKGLVYFDTKQEAEDFIKRLPKEASVVSFESKKQETLPPKLFKLATAQIAAGKLGYNSAQTLSIIQSLYEKKYLSYPRTDCEYLSSGEDFEGMLKAAASVPSLVPFIKTVSKAKIGQVRVTKKWINDAKLKESGHSALVPTDNRPDFSSLTEDEQKIYELVCRQFVAIFLEPLIQNKTTLIADIGGNPFRSSGKTLVSEGYTAIFGTKFTDTEIPEHAKGDDLDITGFLVSEKTTQCPKRFTDADLIAVCEAPAKFLDDKSLKSLGKELKIGTPATRSSIIDGLVKRDKYLKRQKSGKVEHIVPTEEGMSIYENLKDFEICKVDMTGHWELELEDIREGKMTLAQMESGMKDDVARMIDEIKSAKMSAVAGKKAKKIIGTCPVCGGSIISAEKSFYCSNFRDGCKFGAFRKVCGATIEDNEFLSMIGGGVITKTLKKDSYTWEQPLCYKNGKIEFIVEEKTASDFICPVCGKQMSQDSTFVVCSCGFKFRKVIGGHTMTVEEMTELKDKGKTPVIKGLTGKSGKTYDAFFTVKDDKKGLAYNFPEREVEDTSLVCPCCGKNLKRDGLVLKCDCGLKIWTKTCGVSLTDADIMDLINNGRTGLIKGLTSRKSGKKFDTYIVLDKAEKTTKFEFPPRKKK